MYFFSIFNTLADLAMMWLFISATRPDDKIHPLATLVACSTGPYFFNLYPTIMNSAVFGLDIQELRDVKETLRTFEVIYIRDANFKSIMLGTYTFFVVFAGLLMSSTLFRSAKRGLKITRCELSLRTGVPCAVGIIFCMAFYNKMFDVYGHKFSPNCPLSVLILGHFFFVVSLVYGMFVLRKIKDPGEIQLESIRNFHSLYIFGLIISVPLCFMEFQMFSFRAHRFMFSDYESFVRLIFFASILLLEPYNSRFRFRERFYHRTGPEVGICPAPSSAAAPVSVEARPLPKKINLDDMPPNYENSAPPNYESARNLPTSWTITPPSKEYTGVQMTPVETK
ncbi:unnamed protein product [Caenorhabditis sp. 36 PRJEB53466]|nr:unnamed protein product [Caenorhabditis sp. 36 PRJEB53466]